MNDPKKPAVTAPAPVSRGAVAATLVDELVQMSREIAASRAFIDDVAEWLKVTGFRDAFEAFRAQKRAAIAAADSETPAA